VGGREEKEEVGNGEFLTWMDNEEATMRTIDERGDGGAAEQGGGGDGRHGGGNMSEQG
jgi:hypothetical protein